MKILKIILENFTNFSTAQNAKKITIDFSSAKNPICLLIGPNGSGKTSLLSLLHPFAKLGNLDVRNGHELILPGEHGYKEIHIARESDIYVIRHFYAPTTSGSHSVKSYIEKNGDELNPNGNVSSFEEFVKDELDVEIDFLKLIRLGSNVTTLIKLSETERKNFMSKLLDDVGIYLQFHKKVNSDLRQLKDLMAHDTDKLTRLGIKSLDDAKEELDHYETSLIHQEEYDRNIRSRISVLDHETEKVEDPTQLKLEIKDKKRHLDKMSKVLDKKLSDGDDHDLEYYENEIKVLETDKAKKEGIIAASDILVKEYLDILDDLYNQRHSASIELNQMLESDKEAGKMADNIKDLEQRIKKSEELLKGFETECTLAEYNLFIVFLKTTNDTITRCYDFGIEPVREVTALMRKQENVEGTINALLAGVSDSIPDKTSVLDRITRGVKITTDKLCDEQATCPAYKVYSQVVTLLDTQKPKDTKRDKEFYTYMSLVYKILITNLPKFSEYKETISKLPEKLQEFFREGTVYDNLDAGKDIFDKTLFHDFLSLVTEYDSLLAMKEDLRKLKEEAENLDQNASTSRVESELNRIQESINSYDAKLKEENEKISKTKDEISDISRTLDSLTEIRDALTNFEAEKESIKSLEEEYETYLKNKSECSEQEAKLKDSTELIKSLRLAIQKLSTDIHQYMELKEELGKFDKYYDEMTLVKDSLSSKKGIPLYYIDMYLGNTEELTNELLDIVYNGRIYIDNFKLTATEFGIPYYNNGKRVSDIKYASSGEEAFLSLALSFALASQAISKYNIMLLDEVDATLDQGNREKFIRILEKQIDMIDSEQNFLITHNNMFSSYALDIVDFSFNEANADGSTARDQYPLANFIEIIRE